MRPAWNTLPIISVGIIIGSLLYLGSSSVFEGLIAADKTRRAANFNWLG